VLAAQLAHALPGEPFVEAFEAGAAIASAPLHVPTSTTDYPSYAEALSYSAAMPDVLLAAGRRFDRVVLDAGTVDVAGRTNSSFIGDRAKPSARLPGGGGAPDIAGRARELVLLHGGGDLRRIQTRVEHITTAPPPGLRPRLITRWGEVELGADPRLLTVIDDGADQGADEFVAHLSELGVDVSSPASCVPASDDERSTALDVLTAAAARGYQVAHAALAERERTP
jgi:glutaconate CoA-transferase subunit B